MGFNSGFKGLRCCVHVSSSSDFHTPLLALQTWTCIIHGQNSLCKMDHSNSLKRNNDNGLALLIIGFWEHGYELLTVQERSFTKSRETIPPNSGNSIEGFLLSVYCSFPIIICHPFESTLLMTVTMWLWIVEGEKVVTGQRINEGVWSIRLLSTALVYLITYIILYYSKVPMSWYMPWRYMGGVERHFDLFLTLALDRNEWLASHACCYSPWGRCTYYCTKGWVGSTASLGTLG